jgi:hypothetical protein
MGATHQQWGPWQPCACIWPMWWQHNDNNNIDARGEGIQGECAQGRLINDGGSSGPALGGRGFKVSAMTTTPAAQSDPRRVASDVHRELALSHMTCQQSAGAPCPQDRVSCPETDICWIREFLWTGT